MTGYLKERKRLAESEQAGEPMRWSDFAVQLTKDVFFHPASTFRLPDLIIDFFSALNQRVLMPNDHPWVLGSRRIAQPCQSNCGSSYEASVQPRLQRRT